MPHTDFHIIYIVNGRIPNDRAHGVQIVNTCVALGNQGIPVTLVTSIFNGKRPSISEHYGISHVPFSHVRIFTLDVPNLPFRYFIRNTTFCLSAFLYILGVWVRGVITGKRYVVYVRGELILCVFPLAMVLPIFFETHQIRNYESWYVLALKWVKGIVVITENLKRMFVRSYHIDQSKILVARDAVDLKQYEGRMPESQIWHDHQVPAGKKIVLYAGTLAPEKGVDTLAAAALHIPKDAHIVFLGGSEAQVDSFRTKYQNTPRITILGRVPYSEVPRYVVSAQVLVLPDSALFTFSNLYTSPMKLFEYMASGAPIVASKVPSLEEVLTPRNAYFFTPDDPRDLAKVITQVLENGDDARLRAQRAKQDVEAFTWNKRATHIREHIIQQLNM